MKQVDINALRGLANMPSGEMERKLADCCKSPAMAHGRQNQCFCNRPAETAAHFNGSVAAGRAGFPDAKHRQRHTAKTPEHAEQIKPRHTEQEVLYEWQIRIYLMQSKC